MASNSKLGMGQFKLSISNEELSDDEIDVEPSSDNQIQKSENFSDMLSIEEIVTCAIHLGIMENPRKLPCQHAFCCDCLISLVKKNGALLCPICRTNVKCVDVVSLPQALVERQLIDVIMEKRMAQCALQPKQNACMSKEEKEELVKHLMDELKETSSGVYRFEDLPEGSVELPSPINQRRLRVRSPVSSVCSSTYDMMDIETIRENMLKYSSYKEVKRNSIQKFCRNNPLKKHCDVQPTISVFDVHIIKGEINAFEIVFVDSVTKKFFVHSDTEFRVFFIRIDDTIVQPVYIKVIDDDLFVTAVLQDEELTCSFFLHCNMYGKVIRKSESLIYPTSELSFPLIFGFDIDKRNERFFICFPHNNSIRIYNTSLVECRSNHEFDSNRPEYVTFLSSQNQIWVSCPHDRRILIADADTGAFMMFGTDQINQSIPKMIYCTDDERVIFLDSRSNKFIWIKRRGDYILIQRLHLKSLCCDLIMQTFQVLPGSLIVISTNSEFLVFEPMKLKSKLKGAHSICMVL